VTRRGLGLAGALAAAALAAGCNPYLVAQSLPPPGRTGSLDPVEGFWGSIQRYDLELSAGTVLAITCEHGGPCQDLDARSLDPDVAQVIPASLSRLDPVGHAENRPASSFVVVGKKAGTTTIRVKARSGSRRIVVTVVPAPAPAAVVAR
jgi:hypothetical protein